MHAKTPSTVLRRAEPSRAELSYVSADAQEQAEDAAADDREAARRHADDAERERVFQAYVNGDSSADVPSTSATSVVGGKAATRRRTRPDTAQATTGTAAGPS